MRRPAQRSAPFQPGMPLAGYPNDLTAVPLDHHTPHDAIWWIERTVGDPLAFHPVGTAQLGLGAWQLANARPAWRELDSDEAARWQAVAQAAGQALVDAMDDRGRLSYQLAMPHTYRLNPPWQSAMAQGQAASLFVRLGGEAADPFWIERARAASDSLLDKRSPLIAQTPEGPVLQEYPTQPPAHVLNGWLFALFGLHDVLSALPAGDDDRVRMIVAFEAGIESLRRRLHLYETRDGWTRYDLFPHPIAHVASPFYHRLHAELLGSLHEIAPRPEFELAVERWNRAGDRRLVQAKAVARKIGFRLLRPRRNAA